jgi:hypothetical protein
MSTTPQFDALGRVMFHDPAEMVAPAEAHLARYQDDSWTGETIDQTKARAKGGDTARVADAEKLIDQIELALDAAAPEFVHGVAGAFPDVAAFLANDPDNMVSRRRVEFSEKAPVRVWVCTTSSASVSAANLAKRGTAALALAMALIRQGRAVELVAFALTHGKKNVAGNFVSAVATKMRTTPVDIASVAWCMTSGGFQRSLPYAIARHNEFNGQWPSGKGAEGIQADAIASREAACRRLLGDWVAPSDVVLCNVFHGDERREGSPLKNPVAWVQTTLERVANGGAE